MGTPDGCGRGLGPAGTAVRALARMVAGVGKRYPQARQRGPGEAAQLGHRQPP